MLNKTIYLLPSLLTTLTLMACGGGHGASTAVNDASNEGPADGSAGNDGRDSGGENVDSSVGATKDSGTGVGDGATPPATGATDGGWQSRGVGGGGALFVPEISPFDNEIYMATDMGSIFHTADFGADWTTFDFHSMIGGSNAQVRFTLDQSTLYAVGSDLSENTSIYSSTNAGATWTELNLGGVTPVYLEVDPTGTQRMIYADDTILHLSTDGGKTWSSVYTSPNSGGSGIVMGGAFWDGNNIYIGTSDGLVVSTDGTTFSLLATTGIPSGESILGFAGGSASGTTRFFAVTNSTSNVASGYEACDVNGGYGGIYTLTAGQTAWTSVGSGLPSGHQPTFVRMALNDPNTAYAAGGSTVTGAPSVAKTTNAGSSWTDVFQTAGNANIATGWEGTGGDENWGFGQCAEGFAVSRIDSTQAVLTDMGYVHVTNNGGTSWSQAYVEPADQNPAGADTPVGKAYHTSGVEQTSVWGLAWANATTIFGSITDIVSVRSTNSGASWMRESENGLSDNTTYRAVTAASGTMYAATSAVHDIYMSYMLETSQLGSGSGSVMASTNQGATWTTVHAFGSPVLDVALDPTNADSLYATVENATTGGVYHTANLSAGSASTWTQLAAPPRTQGHPYIIAVLTDGTLVATYSGLRNSSGTFTSTSGVFVSTNQGTSWTDVSNPNMDYWTKDIVIDPTDSTQKTWYVGVFQPWGTGVSSVSGGLFRTTDRGTTWSQIWSGYNVESCTVDPTNANHLFVTTDSQGLWETTNASAASPTFTNDPDYPFFHPLRVFFNPNNNNEVWATSFGGGIRVREY